MRLSTTLWSGLVAGVLLVGLPGGVSTNSMNELVRI